jgi:hypothetical protein
MRKQVQSCVDFGRSFINGSGSEALGRDNPGHNDPRFWVESVARLYEERDPVLATYYQCGSCKAENTFTAKGPGDLFMPNNYDFIPVFGQGDMIIFRRKAVMEDTPYKSIIQPANNHPWGRVDVHLATCAKVRRLNTFEEFVEASRAFLPIVGKTVISNKDTGQSAEIEYPVKTINIHYNPDVLQIDTGPVLYPDLSRRCDSWPQCLSLAFLAYETRTSGFADFILEKPMPVEIGGKEVCKVTHYGHCLTVPAENSLWALEVS